MTYLRTAVWGPAEFVGLPPARLVRKGVLVAVAAASAIFGTALLGAWTGRTALADGEAGLAVVGALVVYLVCAGAGRALVGVTALLGVCFALQTPQAAAGVVLAERGRVRSVMVTSVEARQSAGADADGRWLCSVTDRVGVPPGTRIWRGCDGSIRPGDALAVVYDPQQRVPPRGVAGPGPLRGLAPWGAALLVAGVTAVVRSYRLPGHCEAA